MIQFLQAQHGDAFFLKLHRGENYGTVVVDGGPGINARLNPFIKEVEALEHIDLMVLTHHDDDHIAGIKRYFEKHRNDESLKVSNVWANCAPNIQINNSPNVSAQQAYTLSEVLNDLFEKELLVWRADIVAGEVIEFPFCEIEIISPKDNVFNEFQAQYKTMVGNAIEETLGVNVANELVNDDINTSLHELAKTEPKPPTLNKYNEAANMSSIAFIVRSDDMSALMLGDAYPQQICEYLYSKGYSKAMKLKVDFVKISHHGSERNTSSELLDLIDCNKFIISTNGGIGNSKHPSRKTIARILCHPERDYSSTIHLYFNYPRERIEIIGKTVFNDQMDCDSNFECHFFDNPMNTLN